MPNETVGQLIREERKRQGLTMEQLGKKMGISGSLVGRYERGEENPKIETVERFANALGILITDLYPDSFYAEEVYQLERSKSESFQARMIRAISELSLTIDGREYEQETSEETWDEPCTAEMKNKWVDEILPEVAKKYSVPLEILKKYKPFYLNDTGYTDDLYMIALSDFSEDGKKALRLLESLNEKGQEAAYRHLKELAEIPRYRADSPQNPLPPSDDKDPAED